MRVIQRDQNRMQPGWGGPRINNAHTAGASGALAASGMVGSGMEMHGEAIAEEVQKKQDVAAVMEADVELRKWIAAQEAELQKHQGKNAIAAADEVEKQFDKVLKTAEKILQNDNQRHKFKTISDNIRQIQEERLNAYPPT